jgi:hypothetical protein
MRELHWTLVTVTQAYRRGEVAGLSVTAGCIEFVLTGGIDGGVVVKRDGTVKSYHSDAQAWEAIEVIKEDSLFQSPSTPTHIPRFEPAIQEPMTVPVIMDWQYWEKRRALVMELNEDIPPYLILPEVDRVLRHAKALDVHFLIDTLWHTGARISEALSLTRESFFLDNARNSYVILTTLKQKVRGRPKKGEPKSPPKRLVPIVDLRYIDAIQRYIATVKPNKGEPLFPMTRHNVGYQLKKLGAGLDLPVENLTPHVFRHSFAINALLQGRNESTIQKWLGHKNGETTKLYLKVLEGETNHLMYGMQFSMCVQ